MDGDCNLIAYESGTLWMQTTNLLHSEVEVMDGNHNLIAFKSGSYGRKPQLNCLRKRNLVDGNHNLIAYESGTLWTESGNHNINFSVNTYDSGLSVSVASYVT